MPISNELLCSVDFFPYGILRLKITTQKTGVLVKLILALFLFVSVPAFADSVQWYCVYDGYDSNGRVHKVRGDMMTTKEDADSAAQKACRATYTICQLNACYSEPTP